MSTGVSVDQATVLSEDFGSVVVVTAAVESRTR